MWCRQTHRLVLKSLTIYTDICPAWVMKTFLVVCNNLWSTTTAIDQMPPQQGQKPLAIMPILKHMTDHPAVTARHQEPQNSETQEYHCPLTPQQRHNKP